MFENMTKTFRFLLEEMGILSCKNEQFNFSGILIVNVQSKKFLGDKGSLLRVEGAWTKGTTDRKKRTAAGWQPGLMWWIDEQVLAPFEISLSEWHIIEAMQPWN